MNGFNGLGMHLGNLPRLSAAQSRSISPENLTGKKGQGAMATDGTGARAARDLGRGWKVSPSIQIAAGETRVLADIRGPGAIQQIWMTPTGRWRFSILRVYWGDQSIASIECPIGDFFASGWQPGEPAADGNGAPFAQISSLAVCVNPGSAFNCYWEMPFRKSCRMTLTNVADDAMTLYYQINYTLTDVPNDAAYFHAQFRRVNPLAYGEEYTLLDGVKGQGHYVGTYMAWGTNSNGWWGEGEIKFFLDGDGQFPTICGTGTEDYFCGSYCFLSHRGAGDVRAGRGLQYLEYTTPYAGMPQVVRPDGVYVSQTRFSLYRWHIMDPIRFQQDLRVRIQALGWRSYGRYLPLQDDLASVAFWYQTLPTAPFPPLPDRDVLEVI
jgi:hypothetical protein